MKPFSILPLLFALPLSFVAVVSTAAPPPNDDFENRTALGSAVPATDNGTFDESADESIWWEWSAPSAGWYRFHLDGTPFGYLNLSVGSAEAALRRLGTSECGGPNIDMDVYCEAGQTLVIEGRGDCNNADGGPANLSITSVAAPFFSLRDVTVNPASVDVTDAAQQIEVTFRLVGTEAVNAEFGGFPAFIGYVHCAGGYVEVSSSDRISGDRNDGTYRVNLNLQRFLKPGDYDVFFELFGEDIASLGDGGGYGTRPPAGVLVVSVANTGIADCDPPVLTGMQIDPDSVDLSDGSQTVTVSVSVTDDVLGVADGWITIFDESGDWVANGFIDSAPLSSGTAADGTFAVEVEIPAGTPTQTLQVVEVTLIDGIGRQSEYSPLFAGDEPFPPGVETDIAVSYSRPKLTITANGGTVDISPDKAEYSPGEQVTLTATPDGDNIFAGWGGAASGSENPLTITMDSSKSISAFFGATLPGSAVEDGAMPWVTGGDAFWFVQSNTSHAGGSAFQSGDIDDVEGGQQTFVETTVNGPGTLTFWWKVSSEEGWDFLTFSVDGSDEAEISGDEDWQQVSFMVEGAGPHVVRWTYEKDDGVSNFDDTAWLDHVGWTPGSGAPTYAEFAAANGLPADPAQAGSDNNGNGHADVFDYAFDLTGGTAPATLTAPHPAGPDTNPGISFRLPADGRPDAIIEAQITASLGGGWQTIATKDGSGAWSGDATVVESPNGDGTVTVTIAEPDSVGGDACFLRLKARLRQP
ncbi:MAG: hypothetical protein R3F11_19020 [Verrucomicrobiales bacterium]